MKINMTAKKSRPINRINKQKEIEQKKRKRKKKALVIFLILIVLNTVTELVVRKKIKTMDLC